MKLGKLTIHNLASIEDAVIDFVKQPLADSGVFLITGDTGSGKTTILDAICLALYANTPRMSGNRMDGKVADNERSGSHDAEKDGLTLSDPRLLMRKGSTETWCRLDFRGTNGLEYVAEWSARRARSGKLQGKQWTLECKVGDSGLVLSKDADIKQEILRATGGLDFEQFCRTVMLAQGEFTKFLESKDNEKAAILEKITGTEIYARIGMKINALYKNAKEKAEFGRKELAGISFLTDEDKAEKAAKVKEYEQANGLRHGEIKILSSKMEWLSVHRDNEKNRSAVAESVAQSELTLGSPEFRDKENLLLIWNRTVGVRTVMKDADACRNELEALARRKTGLSEDYRSLVTKSRRRELQIGLLEQRCEAERRGLEKFAGMETLLAGPDKVRTLVADLLAQRKEEQAEDTRLADEVKNIEEAKLCLNASREDYRFAEEEWKKRSVEVEEQKKVLAGCELEKCTGRQVELLGLQSGYDRALGAIRHLSEIDAAVQAVKNNLAEMRKSLEENAEECKAAEAESATMKAVYDKAEEMYNICMRSANDWAKSVRRELKPGDTCPICGAKILSLLSDTEVDSIMEDSRKQLEQASENYKKSEQKLALLKYTGQLLQKSIEEAESGLADMAVSKNEGLKTARLACEEVDVVLDADFVGTEEKINVLKSQVGDQLDSVRLAVTKAQEEQKLLGKMEAGLASASSRKESSLKIYTEKNTRFESQCAMHRAHVEAREKMSVARGKTESELSSELGGTIWAERWKNGTDRFLAEFDRAVGEYKKAVGQLAESEAALEAAKVCRENECSCMNDGMADKYSADFVMSVGQVGVSSDIQSVGSMEMPDFSRLWAIFFTTVREVGRIESEQNEKLEKSEREVKRFFEENKQFTEDVVRNVGRNNPEKISDLAKSMEDFRNSYNQTKGKLALLDEQIREHEKKRPDFEEDDTPENISVKSDALRQLIADADRSIGEINAVLENDRKNRTVHETKRKELDKLEYEESKWEKMDRLLGDATGNKFRKVALGYVLGSLIDAANEHMSRLSSRYTLSNEPGSYVINVVDAYDGYRKRPASTISGGERFQVSLALALALARMGESIDVDTLFIDEGFGTLSGNELNKAIDTLQTLNRGGRKVGIISHVEGLRERIPVQIHVSRKGVSSASSVEVRKV